MRAAPETRGGPTYASARESNARTEYLAERLATTSGSERRDLVRTIRGRFGPEAIASLERSAARPTGPEVRDPAPSVALGDAYPAL